MKGLVLSLLPVALLLSACNRLEPSEVRIGNDGAVPLKDVTVEVGGQRMQVDAIAPAAVARVGFEAVSDSGIQVTYRVAQRPAPQSCDGDMYVTTGARQRFEARVDAAGGCRVTEVVEHPGRPAGAATTRRDDADDAHPAEVVARIGSGGPWI